MRRDRRRRRDYLQRSDYLVNDDLSDEERGKAMFLLWAHACAALLLMAAQTTWALVTAVRVWRRREAGLPAAVQTGVHKPTLAVLLAARLAYLIFQRAVLAMLERMAAEYDLRHGDSPRPGADSDPRGD
jgi:hypothetical protein